MSKRYLFTAHLYEFLEEASYTHMLLQGIEQKDNIDAPELEEDFILIPWKETPEQNEPDAEKKVIESTYVREMMNIVEGINYWVELSDTMASIYDGKIEIDELE